MLRTYVLALGVNDVHIYMSLVPYGSNFATFLESATRSKGIDTRGSWHRY